MQLFVIHQTAVWSVLMPEMLLLFWCDVAAAFERKAVANASTA